MSVTKVPAALRKAVRDRAQGCCEYCLIHEDDVYRAHEADHTIAGQHGGATTSENLAFACFDCNRRKGPNLSSVDPETRAVVRIFHPRTQGWQEHFRLAGYLIIPLTPIGRATVKVLDLNGPTRLRIRGALVRLGRYPVREGEGDDYE